MYKNLPEYISGKIIARNFGHIGHLTGSKLIDIEDKLIDLDAQEKFTVCKRDKNDLVIITEKIDGMNAGVVKKTGLLYPINRKGYDSRGMGLQHKDLELLGNEWARWVDDHYELYDFILEEGERLVFENCMFQHTLKYRFKNGPVFLLAKYRANNKRLNYSDLTHLANAYNIQQPPLLNMGVAIPPQIIINQYPKGLVGVKGKIEGIVYSYEHNDEVEANAKFVSNELMGTIHPQTKNYNIW
jgi:hypothetical protein